MRKRSSHRDGIAWILVLLTGSLFEASASAASWETWEECTLVDHPSNDGDSFRVVKKGGNYPYILRLYFVDTPETEERFPERVQAQADYWGISSDASVAAGHRATTWTTRALKRPFTVITRKEVARGTSDKNRYYAAIKTEKGWLAEGLVSAGWARVYGQETEVPGLPRKEVYWARLRALERKAKSERVGCWGAVVELQPDAVVVDGSTPRTATLTGSLAIYAEQPPHRMIGLLRTGARVVISGTDEAGWMHISFTAGDRQRKGWCRRQDVDRCADASPTPAPVESS